MAVMSSGPPPASALTRQEMLNAVRATGVPDYNTTPNWANSPPMRKFVDGLPGICGEAGATNALGQCLSVAVADQATYPDSDYYEIELVQYREQVHSDLPRVENISNAPVSGVGKIVTHPDIPGSAAHHGGTLMRGYRQTNAGGEALVPHALGPVIVAEKNRPVRIKFVNRLPTGSGGKLFIPTDVTVMGSGPGPDHIRTGDARTDSEVCADNPELCFAQNRGDLHLHGGRTPWISDGTAHQWITPAGEITDPTDPEYAKGSSVSYVPDMWFTAAGATIPSCAGKTTCSVAGATNNPGPGAQTYYYTNAQSARMMFYHDHSWGITRLNVYIGEVAGYFVKDSVDDALVTAGTLPPATRTIPLIIQDKTFVDATKIIDDPSTAGIANDGTDPTWIWGSTPGAGVYDAGSGWDTGAVAVTGDLWWPHVYVPAQNPYNPDFSGVNPFGRWHYGPWFWPPTDVGANGPTVNPYYDPTADPVAQPEIYAQPPQIPATPNPSWGAEAFMDTPVVNGTAYPTLNVDAATYRFRILNGAHDRFWNLQLYVASDDITDVATDANTDRIPDDCDGGAGEMSCVADTEMKMVPAVATVGFPDLWPVDHREGGVPDPAYRGPAMVQIMTEGGFLPKPVTLPNQPINWNVDPTTFTAGLVLQQNQGGGTLMLGPAERADVLVDFTQFAGKTLILYNDAPAPWPALDPHYDYYTGAPDNRDMGGADTTLAGRGPNTRTVMKIVVAGAASPGPAVEGARDAVPANLAAIQTAFAGLSGAFATGQEPIIVGQKAYNSAYATTFPATWPTWGVSRITDTSLSFMRPDGVVVNNYPMEPKAIQDEMGETFDDYGRMSAKLGLENAFTNAGTQTFILQNFVDPPTEIVAKDQVQIWKITHNGVDTHPVHFHLFEVQLLNRVGWDGFIYLPDDNELGWKDTVRISPLEDTIVALRPAKVPVPFTVPNSVRPLNPAYPIGASGLEAGFSGFGVDENGQAIATTVTNEMFNFGHEYLWHCHILSHEEQDMMRPIVLNANSLLYTDNEADGFWQWNRGVWKQISPAPAIPGSPANAEQIVASGTKAYGDFGAGGLWEWNGYNWRKINSVNPDKMITSGAFLYVSFPGYGLYRWNGGSWYKMPVFGTSLPTNLAASDSILYATFSGNGLFSWNGTSWTKLNAAIPNSMVAQGSLLYVAFPGYGLYRWNGSTWFKMPLFGTSLPTNMAISETTFYATFTGVGLMSWNGSVWTKINAAVPTLMSPSGPDLYVTFAAYGTYKWDGAKWRQLANAAVIPNSIAASGSVLFANFPGDSLKKYEFGAWSPLAGAPATAPSTIVAGF
ncbi:MAG: multicopper oxidase domain-containing protein [Desulfobulbaceae bacterium]|nr:MAG: multicopper oxidase domain-containing protein [Desulfobulbaceae bacterium]